VSERATAAAQVLTFAVGAQTLAVEAAAVAEVVKAPRITRVPQAPRALIGLANLRGRVAPIFSVDALMGGSGDGLAARVIVLDRPDPVGLAVDRVNAMRAVDGRQVEPDSGAVLVQSEDGVTRLVDFDQLLAAALGQSRRTLAAAQPADRAGRPASAAADVAPASDDVAFLQFEVAGQDYALPLEQVREVTKPPAAATTLPGMDEVMVGVVPFRGALLALISVRAVLGLAGSPDPATSRIIVASLGEATLGLLVDGVRAILRAREGDVGAVPSVLNRGAGEARIDAVVRTPDGLVSVLAAERVLREESVAQVVAEAAGERAALAEEAEQRAIMEQFVLFRLAEETYGLPVAAVVEVVRMPNNVTRVPRAPDFVAGVMSYRGAIVPLIDQRRRFVVPGEAGGRERRVIIARLDGLVAGFVVDAIDQILSLPAADLHPTPPLAATETPVFDRIATIEVDGRLILLVDPRQLLDQAERDIVRGLAERADPGRT
jgi:purine-binding chemotaxis protein CheW